MVAPDRLARAIGLSLLVAVPGTSAGQAVIRGKVRADSSRTAIPFASVDLRPLGKSSQASISGLYSFLDVPIGAYRLGARAVGYAPLEIELEIEPNDTLTLDLLLTRKVTQLAPLVVTAEPIRFKSAKMAEFEERRKKGFGRFYDRVALAALEPRPLSDALRRTVGVRLLLNPFPCFGFVAITTRGTGLGNQALRLCGHKIDPYYCLMTVVVDGVRVFQAGDPEPPDVSAIMARDLQAVEIYRGPSELPPEFNVTGSECGVLVLWTRTGEEHR
jgi:hypothetical protein